jgi:hypothetical protein
MSSQDDFWCDWCGERNDRIHRCDGRVFCSVSCIDQYRSGQRGAEPGESGR